MANTARTRPRPAGSGRMARPGASHARRSTRTSPYARVRARRQPQKTGLAKLLERLPTGAAGKAAGSRKGKAGGFAALAAAAGSLAFRNRDKLGGLMSRKRGQEPATPSRSEPPMTPSG
jgi:hypothetical protein